MMAATAAPAVSMVTTPTRIRLIVARCACATPGPVVSRLASHREPARTGRARASASSFQKSFIHRLTGSVILPMRAANRARGRLASRISDASCGTRGLPLFSRSSSNGSDRYTVAHPAAPLFVLANDTAELSNRKMPPIRPLTSRATQKPCLLRPMKNAGIVSLTTSGSSGRNGAAVVGASAARRPFRAVSGRALSDA